MADRKEQEKAELKDLRVWFQFVTGVIVVIGGFTAGTAIGWSSPAASLLEENGIKGMEFAWVASIFALGAAVAQLVILLLIAWMGLKWAIIIAHAVVVVGWVPMTISYNFYLLLLGRFVTGMAGGFCVACPTYIGETVHKRYRGTVGVFFQLFITGGILFAYAVGVLKNMYILNIACGAGGILGIILMILFVPESPYRSAKKGNQEKFTATMQKFRGKKFDYSKEEAEIKAAVASTESWKEGFKDMINLKAFGVILGLHIFQQLTGVNAILYHAHSIFKASGTDISNDLSVIIIGIAQVLICLLAAIAVDRAGRILLFVVSLAIMCVCLVLTGVFFAVDEETQETLAVLPTVALVLYICGFSLGTGPMPWAMLGEYLTSSVKTAMSTIVACVNWLLAFGISWLMPVMMENIDPAYIFFGFAVICVLGIIFCLLFVVETNQKTLEQIRADIATHKPGDSLKKKT